MRKEPAFAYDILEPLHVLGVDQSAESAIIIEARIETRPIKQWTVGREFNRRMKKRFDEVGIDIPYPHRTVYIANEKNVESATLRVRLQGDALPVESTAAEPRLPASPSRKRRARNPEVARAKKTPLDPAGE